MTRPSVGIIGGGLLGLATAYRLAQAGIAVSVYERDGQLGGLAGTAELGGIPVDRYYHVGAHAISVSARCGRGRHRRGPVPLARRRRRLLPAGPADVDVLAARAADLPGPGPDDRVRLGAFVRALPPQQRQRGPRALPLETWAAQDLRRPPLGALWRPLLDSKFDGQYDDLPATYLWARTRRRSARATRAAARSWAPSTAATRCSSTRWRERSARSAARSAPRPGASVPARRRPRPGRRHRRQAAPARLRRHDAAAPRPQGPAGAGARAHARRRPQPLPRRRLRRRAPEAERQPVLRAEHHRPPDPADDRRRDDARHRPRARRRHLLYVPKLRHARRTRTSTAPRDVKREYLDHVRTMFPAFRRETSSPRSSRAPASPSRSTSPASRTAARLFPAPGLAMASSARVHPNIVHGQAITGVAENVAGEVVARLSMVNTQQRSAA